MLGQTFRNYAASKLTQYAARIDVCLGMLTEDQLWMRGSENENSVANLVLHLCGNLGQYVLHAAGGAADRRRRDDEFNARAGLSPAELRERLAERVAECVEVIRDISDERLLKRVHVQNYDITLMEAIFHATVHFGEHTGQILFAAKLFTHRDLGFYGHLRQPSHNETTP
jgi:uncharacterized damage-inducible protein DinB